MVEKSLSADDCVLLQTMDKFKPHLKPYAYRQDAWLKVLNEYNSSTGSLYRQARTLRVKFEKMKLLCEDENRGKIDVHSFELLKKLADETNERKTRRANRKKIRDVPKETPKGIPAEQPLQLFGEVQNRGSRYSSTLAHGIQGGVRESSTPQSSDSAQPPALDSIAVGFSQMPNPLENCLPEKVLNYDLPTVMENHLSPLPVSPTFMQAYDEDRNRATGEIADRGLPENWARTEHGEVNNVGLAGRFVEDVEESQFPPLDSIKVGFPQIQHLRNNRP